MRNYLAFLGLISSFALDGFTSEVEIHRDITVKPTLSPADRKDVTMNCTGSRHDIKYYIKHKVRWTFIANSGKEIILTDSFHLTEAAVKSFNYPNTRLLLRYHGYTESFKFGITIKGVTRGDNGIYRCSLVGEDNSVIDSKDVKLTVVNPIERIRIGIYNAFRDLIFSSGTSVSQNSQSLRIAPGQYMAECKAYGSNPEPVMDLFLNNKKLRVSVKSNEDKSSDFESYNGRIKLHSLEIDAHSASQALVCKANIPGDFYQSSEAGIGLMVQITIPSIMCDIANSVGYKWNIVMCKVSMDNNNDDLVCDNISWVFGKTGQRIENDQRWEDQSKKHYTLESYCTKTKLGLNAMLDITTVNSNSLDEKLFIVYGKGENVHRHPITLYGIIKASASVAALLPVTQVEGTYL